MDIAISLTVFTVSMLTCIVTGISTIPGLIVGYFAFALTGLHRKCTVKKLIHLSADGMRDVLVVIKILLVIGALTATWRMSGTIVYFVYYGVKVITPRLFIIAAFGLTCLISYALGTSFGVSATVGVILMAIARSGNINPALAAGVIFSGVYYGDRCSPVSSAANVVSALTGTDMYGNVKYMHKTEALPLAITTVIYAVISYLNPIKTIDPQMLSAIEKDFTLSHLLIIPVIIMLVLPLFKLTTVTTCSLSIAASGLISIFVQSESPIAFVKACIFGYYPAGSALGSILSGGGMTSMLSVIVILLISCTYSKIFEGTGMLSDISQLFMKCINKIGRFATTVLFSFITVAIFCNQTIASIACATLLKDPYEKSGATRRELAIDLENSVILIGGIVPWSIAATVPLGFMGADISAIPYAILLYAIPLCYFFTKKHFFLQAGSTVSV